MPADKLLESDIKALVLNHLLSKGNIEIGTSVISEFTIDKFSRRVDLAIADHRFLAAFEIKSESDNLSRLEGQINKYLKYFDKVIVAAASKHIEKILDSMPNNVGVWEVTGSKVIIRRRGRINFIKNRNSLLELMRVNELVKLSNQLGMVIESPHRRALENAFQEVSINSLRRGAIKALTDRYVRSYSTFWKAIDCSQISAKHIKLLSPYKENRAMLRKQNLITNQFWENFADRGVKDFHMEILAQEKSEPIFGDVPIGIKNLIAT